METIYQILLFSSIALFVIGLAQIIGLGWAVFIFNLIFQFSTGDYDEFQKRYSGAKKRIYKYIGLFLVVLSIITFFYAGNKLWG